MSIVDGKSESGVMEAGTATLTTAGAIGRRSKTATEIETEDGTAMQVAMQVAITTAKIGIATLVVKRTATLGTSAVTVTERGTAMEPVTAMDHVIGMQYEIVMDPGIGTAATVIEIVIVIALEGLVMGMTSGETATATGTIPETETAPAGMTGIEVAIAIGRIAMTAIATPLESARLGAGDRGIETTMTMTTTGAIRAPAAAMGTRMAAMTGTATMSVDTVETPEATEGTMMTSFPIPRAPRAVVRQPRPRPSSTSTRGPRHLRPAATGEPSLAPVPHRLQQRRQLLLRQHLWPPVGFLTWTPAASQRRQLLQLLQLPPLRPAASPQVQAATWSVLDQFLWRCNRQRRAVATLPPWTSSKSTRDACRAKLGRFHKECQCLVGRQGACRCLVARCLAARCRGVCLGACPVRCHR
mmetsp:Transcript_49096/g.106764  ORF Transcript_49096/g.106764 Transcript_49096/m.106764 type:complete len:413 (-) Transcript_49096:474-1712(-)